MGKITGFLEIEREDRDYAPVAERTRHYPRIRAAASEEAIRKQAARCMDCGIPYCHRGCPVNNQIPDWNDLAYHGEWREAARNLYSTNNFPEITGRVCPAPCEASCTLNIEDVPVTIKSIECAIADRSFDEGWVIPEPPAKKTGKRVAIVGSGPAGLPRRSSSRARATRSMSTRRTRCRAGCLRYGIPDFKLEKHIIERRVAQMQAEGVTFHCNVHVGVSLSVADLEKEYDAILLCGGAEKPRELPIPGRELKGIEQAMDFLPQQNRRVSGEPLRNAEPILAEGKRVVVIGGGDTGSDCIGTSFRQGAKSVVQLEIMPKPPEMEDKALSWPHWPLKLRTSSSQAEGAGRDFSVMTTRFEGDESGHVKALHCVRVDAKAAAHRRKRFQDRGRSGAARHGLRFAGA